MIYILTFTFTFFLYFIPITLTHAADKVFVYCSEGSPTSFGPAISTSGTALDANQHAVYNNLVQFKIGETTIEPALAEKWEVSKDGKSYTFFLRKGVKFHSSPEKSEADLKFKPTRDFQADDVIFSFDRQRLKTHPYHQVNGGSYEMFSSMEMDKTIKEIKKVNPYTVQFILNVAEAPFLANMAMGFASIYSAEYGAYLTKLNQKEKIDWEPIGTGPFKFLKYAKDTLIRYEAHTEYFEGKPKIDKLIFAITPDPNVRYQKLKTGECHFINAPNPNDLTVMKKNPQFKVMEREGLNVGYMAFNTTKAPFDKSAVRKAIHHALNRESYLKAIYHNQATIAENPIPPAMWSFKKEIVKYAYDPTLAKKLLKDAGFPNGFSTELWTLPVSRPYNPNGKKMGEMMQADLAKVGIKVKLVSYDWPTYLNKTKNGEHELAQMGWTGDNGDPDNFMGVLLSCAGARSGANIAKWCHPPFDVLITKGKRAGSQQERALYYEIAQDLFKAEVPWITLAHAKEFKAMKNNVKGFIIDPLGGHIFTHVDL